MLASEASLPEGESSKGATTLVDSPMASHSRMSALLYTTPQHDSNLLAIRLVMAVGIFPAHLTYPTSMRPLAVWSRERASARSFAMANFTKASHMPVDTESGRSIVGWRHAKIRHPPPPSHDHGIGATLLKRTRASQAELVTEPLAAPVAALAWLERSTGGPEHRLLALLKWLFIPTFFSPRSYASLSASLSRSLARIA